MKIVLIQSPVWIVETPPYNLGLLKSFISSYKYECVCFDFNIELFDYYRNTDEGENWIKGQKRDFWHDEKYILAFFKKCHPLIDKWLKKIVEIKPSVVGFTVQLSSLYFSVYLAEIIKKALPETVIIFGGPAAYRNCKGHEIISRFSWIDAICWGESESCLLEMLDIIKTTGEVGYCKGFAIRKNNGKILDCQDVPTLVEDLDALPFADFSNFPLEKYTEIKLPISTSRGCVYKCIFCNERLHWKKYRFRNAQNVYAEIEYQLKKYPKIKKFFFNDSLVNGNIKILKELSDLLIKGPYGITWSGQAAVRQEMTKDFLERLELSGCDTLIYGIESGSNKILKLMGKSLTNGMAEWCLRNTYEAGINVNFNIIVGFPQEYEDEFQETVDFLKRNIKYASFIALTMFYCNKNTELLNSKEILNNIEGTDADNGHIFWRTKDRKNTYEERIGRLRVLKNLCEDKSLWDQARILNLDTKGKETNPTNHSQQPVEAITVKVFDKEIGALPLLCDEDKKDLERAKEYASKGLFDYAILELTKKLNKLPDEPQFLCLLAENYIQKYDYDMASRILKKVVSLYPRFSWANRVMGNLCLKMNNKDEAFIYFGKAIKFTKDNQEIGYVFFDIARYFVSENKKEAIKYLKKAIEMQPENELYNKLLKELISENINC